MSCVTMLLAAIFAGLVCSVHSQTINNVTCEVYDCTKCYSLLVHSALKYDVNQYNMQRVFFPPDAPTPVSVIVYYNYRDEIGDIDPSKQETWFWSSSTFYHLNPIRILQYLSLFFSDLEIHVSSLNVILDLQCKNASEYYMQLFTQRLKLHASNFEVLPPITEDYNMKASAENAEMIMKRNSGNKRVSHFLLSYPVVMWVLSVIISLFGISYFLFAKPHDYLRRVKGAAKALNAGSRAVKSDQMLVVALSMAFSIYVVGMDVVALCEKDEVHEEFNNWYRHKSGEVLFNLSTCLLVLDTVTLLVLSGALIVKSFLSLRYTRLDIKMKCDHDAKKISGYDFITFGLPYYFLLGPILNLAIRINLIIFSFIHNPYHATAVAVAYAVILFSCIATLESVIHLSHYCCTDHYKFCFHENDTDPMSHNSRKHCCHCSDRYNFIKFTYGVCSFFTIVVLIVLLFVYFIAVYCSVPINLAFDEASNSLFSIFESGVIVLGGFVTYWILLRLYKSPLDILIKAKDAKEAEDAAEQAKVDKINWNDMSDALKEKEMAGNILKIMEEKLNPKCSCHAVNNKAPIASEDSSPSPNPNSPRCPIPSNSSAVENGDAIENSHSGSSINIPSPNTGNSDEPTRTPHQGSSSLSDNDEPRGKRRCHSAAVFSPCRSAAVPCRGRLATVSHSGRSGQGRTPPKTNGNGKGVARHPSRSSFVKSRHSSNLEESLLSPQDSSIN